MAVQTLAAYQDLSDRTLLPAGLDLPLGDPQVVDGYSTPGSHAAAMPAWL